MPKASVKSKDLLKAKIAAEAANNAKTVFLANMSHEIRTPLNAVIAMLDLTLETDLTEEQKDNLKTAKEAADNLLILLNDILDISRVEAGKIRLENIVFDAWSVVQSIAKGFLVLANKKNIELTTNIHGEVPHALVGDPTRLRQVLMNLVNNAVKFTQDGKIDITVDIDRAAKGETQLVFSVSDTGIGIAPAKQKMILSAFTQIDPSTTRKYGGAGLGLAIAQKLVSMMGGRLWVKSEEGAGSTFYFTAVFKNGPKAAGAFSQDEKKVYTRLGGAGSFQRLPILNILLAEDNFLNQRIMVKILEKRGWLVTVVKDGNDVLEKMAGKDFDAVLMDIQMPNLDGLEAARQIRTREKVSGKYTPIVAITAHAMPEDERRCLAAGMDGYVAKPIDAAKVYETIEKAVERIKKGDTHG